MRGYTITNNNNNTINMRGYTIIEAIQIQKRGYTGYF